MMIAKVDIFDNADVPFNQCHASSIHQIGDDKFLATWFAGTHESNPDVAIWTAVYQNERWGTPVKVADGNVGNKLFPTWNPVLYQYPQSDTLILFYKVGKNPREWKGYKKLSTDSGLTWSNPFELEGNALGPIKNKPLTLEDGVIISPSSTESLDEIWKAHVEISNDRGKTWINYPINHQDTIEVIQPSILQHPNGDLQVLCRSKENIVMAAFSKDKGKSWLPWQKTNLQNPNSATDAIRLQNGLFIIVYNPDIAGKDWWEGRTKLHIATSKDGINWKDQLVLENGNEGDEYSYPTIIQDDDRRIHITYTWNRKTIKHVILK